jgi:hypothetical protein
MVVLGRGKFLMGEVPLFPTPVTRLLKRNGGDQGDCVSSWDFSGFGFRVSGVEFRVLGFFFGFRVSGWGFGFRVSGFGLGMRSRGARVSGFKFRVSVFGFRVSCFVFGVSV